MNAELPAPVPWWEIPGYFGPRVEMCMEPLDGGWRAICLHCSRFIDGSRKEEVYEWMEAHLIIEHISPQVLENIRDYEKNKRMKGAK